jgi:hypothetical protein
MNRYSRTIFSCLIASLFLMSCSTTTNVYQYKYDSTLDEVFVKQGADFSQYTAVMVDQISVWYPDEYAPSPENAARVEKNLAKAQDLFKSSVKDALSDRFTISEVAGENVLRLNVEFVDLRAAPDEENVPAELTRYEFKTRPGHITMIGQLLDSNTGEQLARAADLGQKQSVGGSGKVDWDAIASDFEYWASVFAAWMDTVHEEVN